MIIRFPRTSWLLAVFVAGAVALTGCSGPLRRSAAGPAEPASTATASTPAAVPVGSSVRSINVGGATRAYRLYRPPTLTARAPLVVMIHGGFGGAEQAENSYGWDAEADRGHFLVAYPEGQNHAWSVGGGCCGKPGATGVDDVAFITGMVAAIQAAVPVDTARIYATGISNGGMMDYRLACDTTIFAAIGPDSATLLGTCPAPRPISVIAIHGTADHTVRYYGGEGDGVAKINGPAVPFVNAMWRTADHCATPATTTTESVTTFIATCPQGRAVELVTIAGAGHQWPGGARHPTAERILHLDPPSTALNATATIWAFFTHQAR